jgi:serine/threonine protein kinase
LNAASEFPSLLAKCRLQIHYVLNHPLIIPMKDAFITGDYLNIVLELADGGGLFQHVNKP